MGLFSFGNKKQQEVAKPSSKLTPYREPAMKAEAVAAEQVTRVEMRTPEKGLARLEQQRQEAERLIALFMTKVEGPVQVANTITNQTFLGERLPVTEARDRVRAAKSSLLSKLFLAAAMTFGAHEVATQTMNGNADRLAFELNDGPLDGVGAEAMSDLTRASTEFLRLEGEMEDGLRMVMAHAKRDIDAVRREEQAQAREAQVGGSVDEAPTAHASYAPVRSSTQVSGETASSGSASGTTARGRSHSTRHRSPRSSDR